MPPRPHPHAPRASGLAWLGGLSRDTKLGGRMLVKYPGLTLVGGLAMAFSIWVGALGFETAVIVAQVAVTVAVPAAVFVEQGELRRIQSYDGGFASDALAPRVRTLSMAVDPTLRIVEITRLDRAADDILWVLRPWVRITALPTGIALLLSLAGIHAARSFAVARRTREIGVRVALGASNRAVMTAIFRRPLTQVAAGVAVGTVLVGLVVTLLAAPPDARLAESRLASSAPQVVTLVAYAAMMFGVCMLACVVPTRRALRVQPTVALRAE